MRFFKNKIINYFKITYKLQIANIINKCITKGNKEKENHFFYKITHSIDKIFQFILLSRKKLFRMSAMRFPLEFSKNVKTGWTPYNSLLDNNM